MAATQIKSLSNQLAKKRGQIKGLSPDVGGLQLIGMLPRLEQQGRLGDGMSIRDFLGESEAVAGFDTARKLWREIQTTRQSIMQAESLTGTGRGPLGSQMRIALTDPRLQAFSAQEQIKQQRLMQESDMFGTARARSNAAIDREVMQLRREGTPEPLVRFSESALGLGRMTMGDDRFNDLKEDTRKMVGEQQETNRLLRDVAKNGRRGQRGSRNAQVE